MLAAKLRLLDIFRKPLNQRQSIVRQSIAFAGGVIESFKQDGGRHHGVGECSLRFDTIVPVFRFIDLFIGLIFSIPIQLGTQKCYQPVNPENTELALRQKVRQCVGDLIGKIGLIAHFNAPITNK